MNNYASKKGIGFLKYFFLSLFVLKNHSKKTPLHYETL